MSELYRRLRRELVRSPKKSAILALGLVVAVVFWAPLIWGKSEPDAAVSSKGEPTPSPASEVAAIVPASTGGATNGALAAASGEPSWSELLVWMRSALGEETKEPIVAAARDPFDAADPTLVAAAVEEKEGEGEGEGEAATVEEPVQEDPNRVFVAGLAVQGALKIGERRFVRLAGKTLAAGDRFDPAQASEGDYRGDDWIVVEIDADGATVQPVAGGEPLRLNLRRPGLPGLHIQATERSND